MSPFESGSFVTSVHVIWFSPVSAAACQTLVKPATVCPQVTQLYCRTLCDRETEIYIEWR